MNEPVAMMPGSAEGVDREGAGARPQVGFVSLGCPKNLVDSEVMMGLLHRGGAELTPRAEDAEILVVNTCSFIDTAKQESVNTILEMTQHLVANGGRARRLIVAGCLVERYRDEIRASIPEVDAVVGTGELERILEAAGIAAAVAEAGPFKILPQGAVLPAPLTPADMAQPSAGLSIGAEVPAELEMLPAGSRVAVGETLVERAASAVQQHSRPLSDAEPGPQIRAQMKIAQSLAETGTTHGDEPLRHRGEHVAHVSHADKPAGNAGAAAPWPEAATTEMPETIVAAASGAENSGAVTPGAVTSRAEGDARERAGRFSREDWQGAAAALPDYLYSDATPRILATPRASAYIKIAEGCDHPCTFCIIPQLRGKFRSRRMGSILAEAQSLVAQGVREITLIGQDTTCYGEDLGFADGLATLLDALAQVDGLKWLRFLYTYPNKVTGRLLETMARHPGVIAPYLDVPLQHASAAVLRRMKRGGSGDIFLKLIERARATVPGIVIRTSFIVGFPGETEEEFAELCAFVERAKIDWMGVFAYSDEEGASAFGMEATSKVPRRTIEARRRRLMRLQQKISERAKRTWVGRTMDVLVEGPSEETELLWEARSPLHAPEIDGKLYVNDFGPHERLVPGTFYRAEITESHAYDLVARVVE